jgi:hypothetical protein
MIVNHRFFLRDAFLICRFAAGLLDARHRRYPLNRGASLCRRLSPTIAAKLAKLHRAQPCRDCFGSHSRKEQRGAIDEASRPAAGLLATPETLR